MRRQHDAQRGLLLAGREFCGDQAAEAVGSQRIRERRPGVPEQRAQGAFVAGGGVGLHHLAQMCVQVKHGCLLGAGTQGGSWSASLHRHHGGAGARGRSGLPDGLLHGGRDDWQREVGGRLHNRLQRLHWLWLWSLHRRLELARRGRQGPGDGDEDAAEGRVGARGRGRAEQRRQGGRERGGGPRARRDAPEEEAEAVERRRRQDDDEEQDAQVAASAGWPWQEF